MRKIFQQLRWHHGINLLALIIIGYIGFSTVHVIGRNYRLQQEVDQLNEEIALLELQNQELEYQIAYYQTDAFVDKEARDKLGLRTPGEQVVIFPDKVPLDAEIERPTTTESFPATTASKFEQWLYFLFKIEPR